MGLTPGRLRLPARFVLTASLLVPAQAGAQGVLERADLRAYVLPDSGIVRVEIRYEARARGETSLPLAVLDFAGITVEMLEATVDGVATDVALTSSAGPGGRATSNVAIQPQSATDSSTDITLRYNVRLPAIGAARSRVRIPVVAALWPPAEPRPGTVRTEVQLPVGFGVWNAFPASLRDAPSNPGTMVHSADLPVLPALVSFDVRRGSAPAIPFATVLDTLVLVFLGLFMMLGWRSFRSRL